MKRPVRVASAFRARNVALALVGAFAFGSMSVADTNKDRAKAAASGALTQYGSADSLTTNAIEPLTSGTDLHTGNGTAFTAQVSCPGSKQFMRVSIVPTAANDIGTLAIDLDTNFDGSADVHRAFAGPISAVCNNGVVQCAAGTTNACTYEKWTYSGSTIGVTPVAQNSLGACYCFNSSCGANLLLNNSKKVMEDIGTGIATAMQTVTPKLSIAKADAVDPLNTVFFGQAESCASGVSPEAYYANSSSLPADGQAAKSDPNFPLKALMNSSVVSNAGVSSSSCLIQRTITQTKVDDPSVVQVVSLPDGVVESCGSRCMRITLGRIGNNYYSNVGSCALRTQVASLVVNRPDLVSSVRIVQVGMDDWLRARVNGAIVYNFDPGWTGASGRCGENGNRGTKTVSVDVTSQFRAVAPGGTVELKNDISIDDDGEGWSIWEINYDQSCQLATEVINDQCVGLDSDTDCKLESEDVDGVATVSGYYSTGLSPLPSTKTYTTNGCTTELTRPWHQKSRIYACNTATTPYDVSAGVERWQSIHSTLDPTTGSFTDKTMDANGNWSTSAGSATLPPPEPDPGRTPICKTRKPATGAAMGQNGAVTNTNSTGIAWDYTYRECTDGTTCPVEAGETVVSACSTQSNFAEAASVMQTIRQAGQDMVCTGP